LAAVSRKSRMKGESFSTSKMSRSSSMLSVAN
jgi:hypothetical protein